MKKSYLEKSFQSRVFRKNSTASAPPPFTGNCSVHTVDTVLYSVLRALLSSNFLTTRSSWVFHNIRDGITYIIGYLPLPYVCFVMSTFILRVKSVCRNGTYFNECILCLSVSRLIIIIIKD
uniref:Uncharacterized protein n=1 Tax=Cacopsylla melanoneura TaxID=428564 RepID=A0A8D9AXQ8_9HEMI